MRFIQYPPCQKARKWLEEADLPIESHRKVFEPFFAPKDPAADNAGEGQAESLLEYSKNVYEYKVCTNNEKSGSVGCQTFLVMDKIYNFETFLSFKTPRCDDVESLV